MVCGALFGLCLLLFAIDARYDKYDRAPPAHTITTHADGSMSPDDKDILILTYQEALSRQAAAYEMLLAEVDTLVADKYELFKICVPDSAWVDYHRRRLHRYYK